MLRDVSASAYSIFLNGEVHIIHTYFYVGERSNGQMWFGLGKSEVEILVEIHTLLHIPALIGENPSS